MPKRILKTWFRNESGATAIEYSMIAAGISVAVIMAIVATGNIAEKMFDYVAGQTTAAIDTAIGSGDADE